jgi:hypothetical protein
MFRHDFTRVRHLDLSTLARGAACPATNISQAIGLIQEKKRIPPTQSGCRWRRGYLSHVLSRCRFAHPASHHVRVNSDYTVKHPLWLLGVQLPVGVLLSGTVIFRCKNRPAAPHTPHPPRLHPGCVGDGAHVDPRRSWRDAWDGPGCGTQPSPQH